METPIQHLLLFLGLNRFFSCRRLETWDEVRLGRSGDCHHPLHWFDPLQFTLLSFGAWSLTCPGEGIRAWLCLAPFYRW